MPIPENFIRELEERSDIVDVVGSYVRLSKKSGANLFGLCPFHSEKTPSFSVSPDKQIYHCFGCGKGGGVFSFIMEIENLSFPEAVEFLAKRAGMTVPQEAEDAESRKRARLYALNKDAARFFYEQLSAPAAEGARTYMARRRIGPTTAKNFGVGFAPDSWDSLRSAMKARGYSDAELFAAGLVRRGKNGGFYDTFRKRLMFPVIDVRGNVVAFSGRILGDGEPKYMNSPETPVFSKSRNLFALNLAKKSKSGYIILSEGNIDVVSLHQAGFDSAVASLGTSLTPEQARLISRYTDTVIIAYDNDNAGHKAAQRAIGILEKLDLKVKVLMLTGAKDPDEYIQKFGPDAFRNLLEASENQVDYRLRQVESQYDLNEPSQKVEYLQAATKLLAELSRQYERQIYAMQVAEKAGVKADVVIDQVERSHRQLVSKAKKQSEKEQQRPERRAQPTSRIRYEDPASAVAEEGLIRLLVLDPSLADRPELPEEKDFSSPELGKIYAAVRERLLRHAEVSANTLSAVLSSDEISLLTGILQKPEQLSSAESALGDYIKKIEQQRKRRTSGKEVDLLAKSSELRERKGYKG